MSAKCQYVIKNQEVLDVFAKYIGECWVKGEDARRDPTDRNISHSHRCVAEELLKRMCERRVFYE